MELEFVKNCLRIQKEKNTLIQKVIKSDIRISHIAKMDNRKIAAKHK